MITVTPVGGLCNRLRAIASAAEIAATSGQQLKIKWWRTDDLNCAFDTLFDMHAFPFKVVQSNLVGWRGDWIKAATYSSEFLLKACGLPILTEKDGAALAGNESALSAWAARRRPRIRTSSMLCETRIYREIFVPTHDIRRAIAPWRVRVIDSVGVHVRRTDNKKAAEHSTIDRFINCMYSELAENPTATFFVSSDSPETFDLLKDEFGERVFQREKRSFERSDPAAIQDALIDLLCLGACRKLLGSYWSSFTDVAWRLRGIGHVIVTSESAPVPQGESNGLGGASGKCTHPDYPW